MFNRTTLLMLALLVAVPAIASKKRAIASRKRACQCENKVGALAGIRGTIEFIRFEDQDPNNLDEFRPIFKSEEGCGFEWVETLVCRTSAKMFNPPWGNKTLCEKTEGQQFPCDPADLPPGDCPKCPPLPNANCDPNTPCGVYCETAVSKACDSDADCEDFPLVGIDGICAANKCVFSCDEIGQSNCTNILQGQCKVGHCFDTTGNLVPCTDTSVQCTEEGDCDCPAPCPEGMCCENGECPVRCPLFTDAFDYAATTRIRFCTPWCPDRLPSIIIQLQLRFTPFTGDPLVCTKLSPANIFLAETDNGVEPVAAFLTPNTPLITAITETQFEFFNAITIFAKDTVVGGNDVSAATNADNAFRAFLNGNKNGIGGPGEPLKLHFAAF